MAPSPLDKQIAYCKLTRLLADEFGHGVNCFVCDVEVKMVPMDGIWPLLACLPSTLPPYRSASGIAYASKKLSKMVGNSASYLFNI